MKKYLILGIIILTFYSYSSVALEENIKIPEDSLRIRVIPNSNEVRDQQIKLKVKKEMQDTMYQLLKDSQNIEEARTLIENNVTEVDKKINQLLVKENYNLGYNINFGYNYFPKKAYNGITYDEGYYESLVVKLGKGEGNNWWCVLYPTLCLVEEDNEYKSVIKKIIENYF